MKAVDRLIEAFGLVPGEVRRDWRLRIVGPDEVGWMRELVARSQELGVGGSVDFAGPRFGEDLQREYEDCDCLALVSHTENFGATVVDAMAHGKVVVTGSKTPWRIVEDRKCGWWVGNEPQVLAKALAEMMSLSDEARAEMGARGRALVEEKYTWEAVAKKMVKAYEGII